MICSKAYSVEFSNDFALMFMKWIFQIAVEKIKSNLSLNPLHYVETCNELVGPISASLRLWATQLLSKKCPSDGEPLVTLCLIWPARDLNLGPPAPETNALPLDQLAEKLSFLRLFIVASCITGICGKIISQLEKVSLVWQCNEPLKSTLKHNRLVGKRLISGR